MANIRDFEEYHKSYDLHWDLRKRFLLTHSDKLDEDRLLCLSNVFINVECYGAKYPNEVMDLVKKLGADVYRRKN